MAKRKREKKPNFPPNDDTSMMIAGVPVKIAFMHGDETLGEYEDTINLTLTQKTAEGRQRAMRLNILTALYGQPLDCALFLMAREEVQARTDEFTQTHAQTDIPKREAGNNVHLCVLPNGNILYRMMVKN